MCLVGEIEAMHAYWFLCCAYISVFPTEGFLRPGTQVRQFGRKLKAFEAFFV